MRGTARLRSTAAAAAVLLLCGRAAPESAGPAAGGRLIWDLAPELDLIGDLWTELPFRASERDTLFLALDARTSIEQAGSDLAFRVRDLDYALDAGWRTTRWGGGRVRPGLRLGQRGKEHVDADGQAWVRYAALELSSPHYARDLLPLPAAGTPLHWWILVGPVLDDREVDADFHARAAARLRVFGGTRGAALGLDLELDGLGGPEGFDADIAAGPRLALAVGSGRQASLFLHYLDGENPLGLAHSGWLAGFAYAEDPAAGASSGIDAPDIDGLLAPSAGDAGRLAGRLALRFLSPQFAHELRAAVVVDANLVTAGDTGDLFYRYHAGLERPLDDHVVGLWFFHRSNHELAEPNDRVTSMNVIETGIETAAWDVPGLPERRARRGFDARARVGYLIDSSFGEDRRWHVRGGARWLAPAGRARRAAPYLSAEAEAGDVLGYSAAVGVALRGGLELQIERRSDEQSFSSDSRVTLVTVRYALGSPPVPRSTDRAR